MGIFWAFFSSQVLVNHSVYSFDGTSASAPAFAALISRLNGLQAERGEPPLGLLNPWLYQAILLGCVGCFLRHGTTKPLLLQPDIFFVGAQPIHNIDSLIINQINPNNKLLIFWKGFLMFSNVGRIAKEKSRQFEGGKSDFDAHVGFQI